MSDDTTKKVNAKFTRTDDTSITVHGIDEDEIIGAVAEIHSNKADGMDPEDCPLSINIGPVKKIDIIDKDDKEIQTVYGDKNNS